MTFERPAGDGQSVAVLRDLIALGGAGASVTAVGEGRERPAAGAVRIGLHRAGPLPTEGFDAFDILLCGDVAAPPPWVGVDAPDAAAAALVSRVGAQPAAAAVAAQVLRTSERLSFEEALVQESVAYSMLLASEGFRAWRAANPPRERAADHRSRVAVEVGDGGIAIRLNRPDARNAFDARMRDELCEALEFASEHPDAPPVELSGAGLAFSAGGDLDEFGRADDPGRAHLIRTLRSPARLAQALGGRLTARLHGACVGAGIEVPAAAAHVTARAGAFFRLPEVSMGLIPGAGGTASIPRRIGRHRACYMAISGSDIDVGTALAWGLVDAVTP
ncbi:MAG TPA: enoyl-CoA hydratase/isomerase family protein [Caulobacteraceae bacterium]|nr:enoyl-CoA hydratase/isomerase family protein [Caulobacteraceae bacterium]